ncbi:uncharacterized protein FA14DRAFT_104174, partial [Meira miltonrushii]
RSKRRLNNDLLRNYYGLDSGSVTPNSIASGTGPMGIDNTALGTTSTFKKIMQQRSLSQLLKEESDLLTEIRELDGERQSLVYNHHHELVSASETMKNMKEQADALLPSMNAMQSSLQSISSTSESLVLPKEITQSLRVKQSSANSRSHSDILAKAQPVIELPQRLRDAVLLGNGQEGLTKAQGLWGSLESVLANWDEAGVKGAKEIMNECRQVLRQAQQ